MKLLRDTPTSSGETQRRKMRERLQQRQVVHQPLAEAQAPGRGRSRRGQSPERDAHFPFVRQEFGHFGHHIIVSRIVLHGTRLTLHVHQTHAHFGGSRKGPRPPARAAHTHR